MKQRREKRKRKRVYRIVKEEEIEWMGKKVKAYIVIAEVEGRNGKEIARKIRSGELDIGVSSPNGIYLISRMAKIPDIAFQPYKKPRRKMEI